MVVKITRPLRPLTRAIDIPDEAATADPVDELKQRIAETTEAFRKAPATPESFLVLENELARLGNEAFRQVLQREANRVEPPNKQALPNKVRYHQQTYRINKRTPARIATRFGAIVVRSFYYLNEEAGEPRAYALPLAQILVEFVNQLSCQAFLQKTGSLKCRFLEKTTNTA